MLTLTLTLTLTLALALALTPAPALSSNPNRNPNQVNELLKDKDDLTAERDAQVEMIAKLRTEVTDYLAAPSPEPRP